MQSMAVNTNSCYDLELYNGLLRLLDNSTIYKRTLFLFLSGWTAFSTLGLVRILSGICAFIFYHWQQQRMQQYKNTQLATILSLPSFPHMFDYSTTICARSSTTFLHPSLIFGYSSSYFTERCVQTPLSRTSIHFIVVIFACSIQLVHSKNSHDTNTILSTYSPLHTSPSSGHDLLSFFSLPSFPHHSYLPDAPFF